MTIKATKSLTTMAYLFMSVVESLSNAQSTVSKQSSAFPCPALCSPHCWRCTFQLLIAYRKQHSQVVLFPQVKAIDGAIASFVGGIAVFESI